MKPIDSYDIYFDGLHYDLQHTEFIDDIPYYVEQARKYGGPVLELACGTGRIAIPIAAEGIEVTGLDVSDTMLERARQKAGEQGIHAEWVRADCRDFHLDRRFKLALFPFNSIAHLHQLEDIEACFACVREHLLPGGRFLIDIFNPRLDILIRDSSGRYPSGEYADPDGHGQVVITENNVYDRASQVNKIRWYYRTGDDDKEKVAELNMRIYYPQELDALLSYNGFTVEDKFGDFSGSPFGSDSTTQVLVCIRA
jgi:ubiquinone/menaquinone biosynthesis C-methylase UbiE